MDEPKLTVHKVPVIDTGIGRMAGYRDDAEFIEVAEREHEQALSLLKPEVRAKLKDAERESERQFLRGT